MFESSAAFMGNPRLQITRNHLDLPVLHVWVQPRGYIFSSLTISPPGSNIRHMDSATSLDLNTTIGALQIGALVSYVLFGVTTTQMYIYYSRFPEESLKLRALVGFVWVCELAHALCIGHALYVYTISDYTHSERLLGAAPKSSGTSTLFSGLIAACVQGFFSFRIYCLSKQLYISILIWAMVFFRLLGNIMLFSTALEMKSMAGYVLQWEWLPPSVWSLSAANDLTITATLVLLLYTRRPGVHRRTAALLDKLILWTIETGMLTSASSIITLSCFVTMKTNFIWMAVFVVDVRLFSNSLLASLNSRATLRAMNEVSFQFSTPIIELASNNMQMTKAGEIADDADVARVHGQCDKEASEDV
ncbi:hypothetical protein B0H19DRAFT_1373060 [Mycena capillaripes]|nr:hypothetical protein B0H19DRAFT_1373060 [Mycena capillaripes]